MENSDDKYFEGLATGRAEREEKFEVQLAKATRTIAPKTPKSIYIEKPADTVEGTLTIDVFQTPNEIVVESAIAGVRPEDLEITATSESVSIKGHRHREEKIGDENYFYQECFWGKFSRSVILPQEVDPEGAAVSYRNGVLTVKLPKLNRHKTKKLDVQIG